MLTVLIQKKKTTTKMYISDLHDEDLEIAIKVKTKVQLHTYNLLTLEGANRKIRVFLANLFVDICKYYSLENL